MRLLLAVLAAAVACAAQPLDCLTHGPAMVQAIVRIQDLARTNNLNTQSREIALILDPRSHTNCFARYALQQIPERDIMAPAFAEVVRRIEASRTDKQAGTA